VETGLAVTLSTATGAALIGTEARLVQQEFRRVLGPTAERPAGAAQGLNFRELLYLQVVSWLNQEGLQLSPSQRQEVYFTLCRSHGGSCGQWARRDGQLIRQGAVPVSLDLSGISQTLRRRYRLLRHPEHVVECNPAICSGEPVFLGTRVPLSVIVGQLQAGVEREELASDFPQLSEAALDFAEIQARLPKPPGRPKKALQLKRG
jgi:uncharacterized protein (DUF433 family)